MKILIFGQGYVASHFERFYADNEDVSLELSDSKILDYSELRDEIALKKPDVVINCAGKTGRPNVDWCEDHKMETLHSNLTVPVLLAKACEELGVYMVHVGSGCVYEGDESYSFTEEDAPNFAGSFYSRTKAWSEQILKEFPVLQLRLRMPLDGMPGPRNFVTKIAAYQKVISLPNSISVLDDFLLAANALISARATGVFNLTNPGYITHAEILDLYKEFVDPNFSYEIFSLEEMEQITKAKRSNCVLSTEKLEKALAELGLSVRPVYQAVRESLIEYGKNLS